MTLLMFVAGCGGSVSSAPKKAPSELQTVSFQKPLDPGPAPFTEDADVKGKVSVDLPQGQGPFGGSGSNRVCDRDLLIRFLRDHPDRMREWARVQGIPQTFTAVKRYIAKLHPVTLTRDTQVTNHNFVGGRAVAYQAILQAGTAVLVDSYGVPVARCRCGNPLKPAVYVAQATCRGCPPHYRPPRPCDFGSADNFDETYYRKDYYANGDYDEVFIRRSRSSPFRACYEAYPDPPTVTLVEVFKVPDAQTTTQPPPDTHTSPSHEPAPDGQLQCHPPRSQLEFEQCAALNGTQDQTQTQPQETHTQPAPQPSGQLNCDAPQSQLEAEQCAGVD